MGDYHYHHIMVESTLTMNEVIQDSDKSMNITRTVENNNIVFIIRRTFQSGANISSTVHVRNEPYLFKDLQELFLTFYQVFNYTETSN